MLPKSQGEMMIWRHFHLPPGYLFISYILFLTFSTLFFIFLHYTTPSHIKPAKNGNPYLYNYYNFDIYIIERMFLFV